MFFCSVQIISWLANQTKFLMFTLITGRHIGGSILGSIILAEHFDEYLKFGATQTPWKLEELSSLLIVYNIISQFSWLHPLHGFCMNYFLLRDKCTHSLTKGGTLSLNWRDKWQDLSHTWLQFSFYFHLHFFKLLQ